MSVHGVSIGERGPFRGSFPRRVRPGVDFAITPFSPRQHFTLGAHSRYSRDIPGIDLFGHDCRSRIRRRLGRKSIYVRIFYIISTVHYDHN